MLQGGMSGATRRADDTGSHDTCGIGAQESDYLGDAGSASTPTKPRQIRVAIIGGGVSGIICASVLQQEGHDVQIFEQASQLGGHWIETYPQVRLQNMWSQYCHPDWSETSDCHAHDDDRGVGGEEDADAIFTEFQQSLHEFPTGRQVLRYWQACARHFQIPVNFNTRIVELKERAGRGGGWTVRSEIYSRSEVEPEQSIPPPGSTTREEEFDFVVIAQGQYSRDDIEIPWEGAVEEFKQNGGILLTRQAITEDIDLKDKKVIVVGFGKTALDMCVYAVDHGASFTTHLFREAHFATPQYILGIHFSYWVATRFLSAPIPCWGHPSKGWAFIHSYLSCLIFGMLYVIKTLLWWQVSRPGWCGSKEIRQRMKLLKPQQPPWKDFRSAAAYCPDQFFPYVVQNRLVPVQGEIQRLTPSGLVLQEDGRHLEADVILACIGNGSQVATFPYLPNQYRACLEQDPQGAQLYRHLITPDVPNLAIMGWNHGVMHCAHVYLGSLWLSTLLRGEMKLPPPDEQRQVMQRIADWKRQYIHLSSNENGNVQTRSMHYNDTLLLDMGLTINRKPNRLVELFGRYDPRDYRHSIAELQDHRRQAGGTLELTPFAIDM